jgi:hypothetical protein
LKRARLIRIKHGGYQKYYELTARGQAILTRSELPAVPCTMEDYPMKFRLIADNSNLDWKKLGDPKNWVKLCVKIGHVTVEKNLGKIPTVIIHTGQIVGFHPDHCLLEAGSIIADVKAILQGFGVLLEDVGLPLRKNMFKFYDEEDEILHELFGNVSAQDGALDDSPPDNIPHTEHGRKSAINKIKEPNRIAKMDDRTARMDKSINQIKNT